MKLARFSFKNEAMWVTIATFAVPALALIAYLVLALVRYFRS